MNGTEEKSTADFSVLQRHGDYAMSQTSVPILTLLLALSMAVLHVKEPDYGVLLVTFKFMFCGNKIIKTISNVISVLPHMVFFLCNSILLPLDGSVLTSTGKIDTFCCDWHPVVLIPIKCPYCIIKRTVET